MPKSRDPRDKSKTRGGLGGEEVATTYILQGENIMFEGNITKTIYYNEDLVKNLKKLKAFLKKVKPQDYYVRGFEDSRIIMIEVVEIIIQKLEGEK